MSNYQDTLDRLRGDYIIHISEFLTNHRLPEQDKCEDLTAIENLIVDMMYAHEPNYGNLNDYEVNIVLRKKK